MHSREQDRAARLGTVTRLATLPWLWALFIGPIQAQTATTILSPITVSGSAPGAGLSTPVSTGSGLDLTPMQTPASVEVISREQLEERGDHSVVDAITRAGGISAMGHPGNGGTSLSARGFTDTTSVMRLYDGMRQYGGVGLTFPFDTWSIDRIEVLRGPASVIYGDGAIGGVVNVIPRKPTRGPVENELQATLGTDDTARLALGSGGALSDRWSYRVDLSGARSDGWVDHGQSRSATFSGALQWDVSDNLSLRLSHAYGYQKPMKYFGSPLIDRVQQEVLREKNYNVWDSEIRYRDQWTDLFALWTPNAATTVRARLYHIDSQRDYRNGERYMYNGASGLIDRSDNTEIHHNQKQTGLTADAAFDGKLFGLDNKVLVGFDVSASSFEHSNNTYSGSSPSVDPYNPVPGYFHSDEPTIPRYRNKADQYALFIEDRLALTSAWSVLAGLRYDHTKLNRKDLVTDSDAFERTYADFGWRVGTVYDLTPNLALYAQYSVAADPVGGMLLLSPANSQFDMSKGKQLEVGLKQTFWEGSGEWTLAAYHIKKNDLLSRDPANPALRIQVGAQSSRGLEASVAVTPARGWRVEANASILRARFDDFQEASGGAVVSRQGNVPPNVAQRLANVWVSWNFQPGWTAMAGLRYVGKRYADNANSLELPSYTTTDLALRWDVGTDTTITARGFNVFDKAYFTTAYYTPTQWLYGPGRRFELTLNHRF
ncbi:TonB-dependent receptor [Pollutimonas harenae]|uniref:TonB-dependent receptor n=1 Tax=Pollutimonas harenae TaxID=657015 RepID=A0A853GXE1_9BURK|nr:TonB-dependent receptor [Pollutimonas harenae]NYT87011.1 TonB-dependent receptor [Pollutimonas harenae]TEA69231.1 TonB-dependent receptor [Pollutimonas harenae]